MDRRLLWHWTSDLFKLNFPVHNPPPCKNQKQKSQTKESLLWFDLDAGEKPRHTETKRRNCMLHCPGPRPWLWTVVMIATMFRGLPALCPASRPSASREPLHTFTLWWWLRGYWVPTPRPCHLACHMQLLIRLINGFYFLRIEINRRPRDGRP